MKTSIFLSSLLTAGLLTLPVLAASADQDAAAGQEQPAATAQTTEQTVEQAPGAAEGADSALLDAAGDADLAEALIENNEAVRLVQQALIMHGYDIEDDGLWGAATKRAMQDFQETSGIEGEGMPTMATLQQLGLEVRPIEVPQAAEGPTEESVEGEEAGTGATGDAETQDAPQTD